MKAKAAKSAAKGAAPKRKYTKRAGAASEGGMAAGTTKLFGQMASNPDGAFVLLGEIRQNLGTLTMVRGQFGDLPSLTSEVDAQVEALGQLREKLFAPEQTEHLTTSDQPADEVEEEETPTQNGVTPVALAPVPLPPLPVVAPPQVIPAH